MTPTVFASVSQPGSPGPAGPAGYTPQFIVAAGKPNPAAGNNGDMWIDSSTGDVYGPKVNHAWPGTPACNIEGPPGPEGPPGSGEGSQTPWLSNIEGATFELHNVSRIGIANTAPAYPLDVVGDVNITGVYRVNGVPLATGGGSQTPWTSDIDAGGFKLNNLQGIGIGGGQFAQAGFAMYINSTGYYDSIKQVNASATGWAGFSFQNDTGKTYSVRIYGSGRQAGNLAMIESGGDQAFGTNAVERMRITQAGLVGIGTQPVWALDVLGDVNVSGVFRINGVPLSAGSGAVTSVFTRTGAVAAATGDYTAAQVTNAVSTLGSYADPAWITSLAWTKITGAPTGGTGSQTPWTSDIEGGNFMLSHVSAIGIGTAANAAIPLWLSGPNAIIEVDNANAASVGGLMLLNDQSVRLRMGVAGSNYPNPAWSNCAVLWTQAANDLIFGTNSAERLRITTAGLIGIGRTPTTYKLEVAGDINITGAYRVNGVAIGAGAAQTPWTSDIDAASHMLFGASKIGIGTAVPTMQLGLGYTSNDLNVRAYPNFDQGGMSFYVAQNFPAANSYGRVLDLVAGGSNSSGTIRLITQNTNAAGVAAVVVNGAGVRRHREPCARRDTRCKRHDS